MPEGQGPEGQQVSPETNIDGGRQTTTPPAQVAGTDGRVPEGQGKQDKTYDADYVKKIRDEAAASRVELKELREKLKQIEEKDLSEQDKTARRLKELEETNTKLAQQQHAAEVRAAAAALGCKKPDLIARLVDQGVENVDRAVAQIKKENPELFLNATGSADGGSGNGQGTGAGKTPGMDMNYLIRSAAGRA